MTYRMRLNPIFEQETHALVIAFHSRPAQWSVSMRVGQVHGSVMVKQRFHTLKFVPEGGPMDRGLSVGIESIWVCTTFQEETNTVRVLLSSIVEGSATIPINCVYLPFVRRKEKKRELKQFVQR